MLCIGKYSNSNAISVANHYLLSHLLDDTKRSIILFQNVILVIFNLKLIQNLICTCRRSILKNIADKKTFFYFPLSYAPNLKTKIKNLFLFLNVIFVGTGRGRRREISLTPSVTNYQQTGFWFCLAAASSGMWTINGASMISEAKSSFH